MRDSSRIVIDELGEAKIRALRQLKVLARAFMSRELAEGLTLDVRYADIWAQILTVELECRMPAVALDPITHVSVHEVVFEAPATPWQHCKIHYERRWWMRLLRLFMWGKRRDDGRPRRAPRMVTFTRRVQAEMTVEPVALLPQLRALPADWGRPQLIERDWSVDAVWYDVSDAPQDDDASGGGERS